jgi:two-component system cell cycle sensor histidine kinase/response regulator CckA
MGTWEGAVNANIAELAQTLFEEAGDALFLFDPEDGRILEINPMAQRLSGMSRPDLLKESVASMFRSSQQGGITRLRRAYRVTGLFFHSQDGFFLRQRNQGTWLPVNLTVARLHARPKTLGLITARDVSEQKRVETALRESEQSHKDLIETANDIIYTTDLTGKLTSINAAGERLTGYAREELLKMNIMQLIAAECKEVASRMYEFNLDQKGRTTYDLEIVNRTGNRIALEISSQVLHRAGKMVGVQGIARDMSERRLLEEQFRQAQKMEAVGQLAGGLAHDYNNLLTVITGYTDVLLNSFAESDSSFPFLTEIREAAERATALTGQLLAFSRRQILQPVVLDLNARVRETVKMLRRLIGEHIEIVMELDSGLNCVNTDPGQVDQTLMNLAVNARDAMPNGGKLTISTANVIFNERDRTGFQEVQPGQYIRLSVCDNGCGMDNRTKARIFEPFYTTKEVGKGTGLGLSMVYGFVKQSNGHITVESEVGRGTTFSIFLPTAAASRPDIIIPALKQHPDRGTETVLLVEDEDSVRTLVRIALQREGYTVLEACHGLDALRIHENCSGVIDLLVTDVVMPQMGGRELAERLTAVTPNLKILYLSGYTDDVLMRGTLLEGSPFLQKPFSPEALAIKVRTLLDEQTMFHP